ncbi:hypothetical protein LBO01_11480 [Companilactobacillus paralimentarius]|uniref:Type I site-specific deoxyribonuclease n=2 Tax=Companilactobacillus bobalius TaxID=2801451 RepID=A0A202FEE6_9LACO|nr:type I restriction-modification system specificity subunit [Companilactobacillus bobalius DSM 19674]OVE98845.1 Type I site-specific deoxyribonuclease [Companilactobacillus bobalius]GEO58019.1 hypothetical protein LBO01_11480 [Companilactobacillus paralimentarius]
MNARIGWQNLRTSEFLDNGNYMLITGTDFKDGEIDYSNIHYVKKNRFDQDKKIQISNGSILITKDGTLGKVAYVAELPMPATLNAGVFNVRIKNENEVDDKYLFHYLKAPFLLKFSSGQSTGGTIKHLNQNVLVKFPVPLPALAEQNKIAKFLTNFDKLITLQQRQLDLYKKLEKGLLQKLFPKEGEKVPEVRFAEFHDDWERYKLGDFGNVSMNKRIFKDQTLDKGIPFYKIGTFGSKPDSYISPKLFAEYKKRYPYPQKGDILISASGSIGRAIEYTGKDEYFQDSNIVWLNHSANLENLFLKQFYKIVNWNGVEGSTIKRLYNKTILNTEIILPTTKEQLKVGNFFDKLDKNVVLRQNKIKNLEILKKYLLQKLFI